MKPRPQFDYKFKCQDVTSERRARSGLFKQGLCSGGAAPVCLFAHTLTRQATITAQTHGMFARTGEINAGEEILIWRGAFFELTKCVRKDQLIDRSIWYIMFVVAGIDFTGALKTFTVSRIFI